MVCLIRTLNTEVVEINEIYNTDCLQGMKLIADGSIDMILCDLPYGTTWNKWDAVVPLREMWDEFTRIIRPNCAVVLTAIQPFASVLVCSQIDGRKTSLANRSSDPGFSFRYEWIWKKRNATGHLNAKRIPMKEHENILVFGSGILKYNPQGLTPYNKVTRRGSNGKNYWQNKDKFDENFQEFTNYPRTILEFAHDKSPIHPTQKPVALFEYLIRTYSDLGDVVLDCCIGSGTTAIACINSGRRYIGFETDFDFFKAAQDRIKSQTVPTDSSPFTFGLGSL